MAITALLFRHPGILGFGFLHALASSAGQTFIIALFLPGIQHDLGLNETQTAALYALATVASAGMLWYIGRQIDHTDLLRFSAACGLLLAAACAITALAPSALVLGAGFFLLRLAGQGLLTHIAATAVARHFTATRGKALSLTSMGHAFGEACLPAIVVVMIGAWGWRSTMAAAGFGALLLVLAAGRLVRDDRSFRYPEKPRPPADAPHARAKNAATRRNRPELRYFVLNIPMFAATPLIVTGLVFHQAVIAADRGFSMQWFAVSFTAFAIARILTALLAGALVDRYSAARLFPMHLLPYCAGIALLAIGTSMPTVPLYWALAGVTSGMAGTLQSALIAEAVAPHQLGRVRSMYASLTILSSAAGPLIYGALISAGFPVSQQLWGTIAAMFAATALSLGAGRPPRMPASNQGTG